MVSSIALWDGKIVLVNYVKAKRQAYKEWHGPCAVLGCGKLAYSKGLCAGCYNAQYRLAHRGPPQPLKSHSLVDDLNEELSIVTVTLTEMRELLEKVTGYPTRVLWRGRIRSAESERRRILKEIARATT